MKYTKMTDEELFLYGKYNLFTHVYPGSYRYADDMDYVYYFRELVGRTPGNARTLINMVLDNAVPQDIPKVRLDIDEYKASGKYFNAIGLAVLLNDAVCLDKVVGMLPGKLDQLTPFEKSNINGGSIVRMGSYQYISLLYEKSAAARDFFTQAILGNPNEAEAVLLCSLLTVFVVPRYYYLGARQTESAQLLFGAWELTPEKIFSIFVEYANNWSSLLPQVDIDIFAGVVKQYPAQAVKFLESLKSNNDIMKGFHSSAKNYWIPSWLDFIYRYCGLDDDALAAALKGDTNKKGEVGKKTALFCEELKHERLTGPVLPTVEQIRDAKTGKKYLYRLFSASKDLRAADVLVYAGIDGLLWSAFDNSRLAGIFVSTGSVSWWIYRDATVGAAATFLPGDNYVYKLFNPADLDLMDTKIAAKLMKQIAKTLKEMGIATVINQTGDPYTDFAPETGKSIERWVGNIAGQQGMIVVAGKNFLLRGHESNNSYTAYHYVNPIDSTGAVLHFKRVASGPEYASVLRTIYEAEFYTLPANGFTYINGVPESHKLYPRDVSPRLKYYVMNMFDSLAKDKASDSQPVIPQKDTE